MLPWPLLLACLLPLAATSVNAAALTMELEASHRSCYFVRPLTLARRCRPVHERRSEPADR